MPDDLQLRPLGPDDAAFLTEALYYAVYVPPGTSALPKTIIRNPDLAMYIDGFGTRLGDTGTLAEHNTIPVGAAWSRFIRGYGFVDEKIPELSIALLPGYRGMGIGTKLLEAMFNSLKGSAEKVSLSVNLSNPAYRLYERHSFKIVSVDGDTVIMARDL